jgi:hypothetical protein
MAEKSLPRVDHARGTGEASPKCCAGCGGSDKSLMAPHPNAREYEGPMFCLSCNPRFAGGGDAAMRLMVSR